MPDTRILRPALVRRCIPDIPRALLATALPIAVAAACSRSPDAASKGASGAPSRPITITNVSIIDGTGASTISGAVRIIGDTIADVGATVEAAPGDSVVDGKGLTVAPGFIDTHSHHASGLGDSPDARAAVSQGITTVVGGQDGGHPMPLGAALDTLQRKGTVVNVAFYAGHGTIRDAVMGKDFKRTATPAEVDSMASLLARELDAGALGLSTGLEYDPGIYSDRAEVLRLAKVAAAAQTRYISHLRSEDRWFWDSVDEILAIGREAKLPVQIGHVKLAMIPLWGQADSLRRVLDRARAQGIDVTADIYPYPYWQSTLTVLFPRRDFDNRAEAEKILREIAKPEGLLLGDYLPNPSYAGKTVAEIAKERKEPPAVTLMTLIRDAEAMRAEREKSGADGERVESVVATSMDERDIATLMAWEHTNLCSDGALDGAHPRGYGAFTRVLGRYVRERKVVALEEAIRKMTSLSAQHVGITRRGTIAPGQYADVVLIDPNTVIDNATTKAPHALSTGIARVWVNGQEVWHDGQGTGARPGTVIRRQQQRPDLPRPEAR
ncbi:MAG TPA: D-aminoacylase [Gemmatimonadaceae bacterium]|nr:D-aminoacylase [Gemmatimonadaceae bacterium]